MNYTVEVRDVEHDVRYIAYVEAESLSDALAKADDVLTS